MTPHEDGSSLMEFADELVERSPVIDSDDMTAAGKLIQRADELRDARAYDAKAAADLELQMRGLPSIRGIDLHRMLKRLHRK